MELSQAPPDGPPPPQATIPSLAPVAPSGQVQQVQQVGARPPAGQGGDAVQVISAPKRIAHAGGAPTSAAPALMMISNTGQLIAPGPTQVLPPAAVRPVAAPIPAVAAAQNGAAALAASAGQGSLLVCYRPLAVEAARKPRIGPKRDYCSTGLHRTPQWQWPSQATTHATAGQRWRQAQTAPPQP